MKKLAKIALSLTALTLSTTTFAGTLTYTDNINVLAFDGKKVNKNSILNVSENQQHQLVVEVSSLYQSGSDKHFFESQPIVISFSGSPDNVQITPPNLQTEFQIDKFKKSPTFEIKTASGKHLTYQQDYLKGEGFMPNANIVDNLTNYNAGNGKAAIKSLAVVSHTLGTPINHSASKGKVTVQGENIAEQQLQYWFQQADKETQKRFLTWAKKQ